jgi:CRISPR system Cascade subunit CasA
MSGYILQHQGIARMNSGFGNRPRISLVQANRLGQHWQMEVKKLLQIRADLLRSPWPYRADGIALTWLPTWDRESSMNLDALDPFFIEISRGARMGRTAEKLVARTSTEKAPRINAKANNGVLGDPWTPLNAEDKKKGLSSLTVSASGFTPKLLRDLVFGDGSFLLQAMQRPTHGLEKQAFDLQASVLVRGQGTTDGFHHALVPVPGKAAALLFHPGPDRDKLAKRSKEALVHAGNMQHQVLKRALYLLLEGGPNQINDKKREVTDWVNQSMIRYAEAWAENFFPWLWRSLDQDDETARRGWLEHLRDLAWAVLQDAIERLPVRTGRGYHSRVRAEGAFYGALKSQFPDLSDVGRA